MAEKGWYLVKSSDKAKVLNVISSDSQRAVEVLFERVLNNRVIYQLTWDELCKLFGGVIPAGQKPYDLAHGNFMIPKGAKSDIVLWPI